MWVCLFVYEKVVRRQLSGVHSFPLFGVAGMKQRPSVLALLPTKLPHHAVTIIFKGFYRRYKILTSVICGWIKMERKLCRASGWVTAVTWDMTALGVSMKGRVLCHLCKGWNSIYSWARMWLPHLLSQAHVWVTVLQSFCLFWIWFGQDKKQIDRKWLLEFLWHFQKCCSNHYGFEI